MKTQTVIGIALLAGSTLARAADPAFALATKYLAGQSIPELPAISDEGAAQKIQAKFLSLIADREGEPVGYRADRPGSAALMPELSQPVLAFWLANTVQPGGPPVPADFGARPVYRMALAAIAGSATATATDEASLWASFDGIVPCVELLDYTVSAETPVTAYGWTAVNAGSRGLILGDKVPVGKLADLPKAQVSLVDVQGHPLSNSVGAAIQSLSLDQALWTLQALKARGLTPKKGEIISLGALTAPQPVKASTLIQGIFFNVDSRGPVSLTAKFSKPYPAPE